MKKLLLFTFLLGLTTITFGQIVNTEIEVTSYISPTGTIYIDGSGTGANLTTIEVNITNNDTVTFAGGFSVLTFGVIFEGNPLADPASTGWSFGLTNDFAPGTTQNFRLTDDWGASTTPGSRELCVSLNSVLSGSTLYNNTDTEKELCQSFDFDFSIGIENIVGAEISEIKMTGDLMTVFVKNSTQQSQIQVMSITGQVVKTVNTAVGSQNFYQNIDISDLTAGVYIVTVQTENGKAAAQKVMIQ